MSKITETCQDLNLFQVWDMIVRRWVWVVLLFLATLLPAGVYCFWLRPDASILYDIKLNIRYPVRSDMLHLPDRDPDKMPNLANMTVTWMSDRTYSGDIQERFGLTRAPKVRIGVARHKLNLLHLAMQYPNEDLGKQILSGVQSLLKSSKTLQKPLTEEKEAIAAEVRKEKAALDRLKHEVDRTLKSIDTVTSILKAEDGSNIDPESLWTRIREIPKPIRGSLSEAVKTLWDRSQKQKIQLALGLETRHSLLGRLKHETEVRKTRTDRLQHMLATLESTYDSEGPVYSELIAVDRMANYQIVGVAGLVGIFLGVLFVFLWEVRGKHAAQRE